MSDLSLSVTHADGRVTRWGGDEPNATDIPADLSFGTSIPGGFKALQCSLLRRIDVTYPDEALFDTVRVYGPGNITVWEGRMAQLPKSHGDSYGVTPGAVGWSAHLRDDPSFREIYVDRSLASWGAWSLGRRAALAGVATPMGKIQSQIDVGGIVWDSPNEALPAFETSEVWYDSRGLSISGLFYKGARTAMAASFEAATMYSSTSLDGTTDSDAITLDDTLRALTLTPARPYLMLRVATTGAVTPAAGSQQRITTLAVYGASGIATHGIIGEPDGVWASDVIRNIVTRAAPLLSTTGIEPTDFPIAHLAFVDPVTAENAISLVNGYHAWDWGVWEDREFFYRQPDPDRLCWEARLSDGARLDLEGDTAEQIFNGVIVSYTDGTGKQRTVGPPGAATDDTDAALEDTSAENPVNAHSIPRRWEILQLSEPTNLLGATTLGTVWLAEHSLPQRRGSLTLTSTVTHPTKGKQPAYMVRAGDYVKIADHSNSVARKIIETSYAHGTQTITLTLDNTAPKLEALLERLSVGRIGRY